MYPLMVIKDYDVCNPCSSHFLTYFLETRGEKHGKFSVCSQVFE